MKELLEAYIHKKVEHPSQAEIDEILAIFEVRDYKKRAFFKRPFTISSEIGFVIKGVFSTVVYKQNGEKITVRILQEESFLADSISVRTEQATPLAFECIEKGKLLVAPIEKLFPLFQSNLAFNIIIREYVTESAVQMGKKHLLFLTGNAKDRYQFILENNPNLIKKFPLRIIASMIGITPTQLSRIRKKTELGN